MLRIYLDTNHWITLLKVKQGKETDKELEKLLSTIMEMTQSDKIRVLFSIFTFIEIQKRCNEVKREDAIDFILDVSKLYGLRPYSAFSNREIENAIEYVLHGRYVNNIYSKILGRGLDVWESGVENLATSRPLQSSLERAQAKVVWRIWQILSHRPEFVKRVLKDYGMVKIAQKSQKDHTEMINTLEQQRRKNSNLSKIKFYRYARANHILGLDARLFRIMMSKGIESVQIFSSKERCELFLKHLNSLNVKALLIYERDIADEEPITYNDFLDIEHLAGAIPYCDIVVSDKAAVALCRRKKLDKMYNCHILSDLKKLSEYL